MKNTTQPKFADLSPWAINLLKKIIAERNAAETGGFENAGRKAAMLDWSRKGDDWF
jgi:hypothetical protein